MTFPCRELEIPCLVAGGGPAGYGAAVAALRGGCPAMVVERHGFFGGMGTAAGLSCYLNHLGGGVDLAAPVYRALVRQQDERGAHYHDEVTQADFFEPEACKHGMEETVLNAGGQLLFHAILSQVRREGEFWVVEVTGKGARVRIRSRYLIDATGDGDACALAGAGMTHGRRTDGKTQPMSMVVQMGGFKPADWQAAGHRLIDGRYAAEGDHFASEVLRAREGGRWTIPRENIALFWAMPGDPTRVSVNGTRINGLSACNPFETTRAEIEGRRQAREVVEFFRRHVPGFGGAYLLQTGPQIGVRESRRIAGRATLTEDDVRACAKPSSSVMLCAYPIDVHHPEGIGTQYEVPDGGHVYGIPWECLLPEGLENIAAAGRCISATHEAAGSFRVMPTCMGLGEAAGTAAALAYSRQETLAAITGREIRAVMDAAHRAAGDPPPSAFFPFGKPAEPELLAS
jgi:hypothetical protein